MTHLRDRRFARSCEQPRILATLGIVNTGVAYWLFYLLIDEAGQRPHPAVTYLMPVVALFLGVALLGERLTIGAVAGLVLIAIGAWLATSRGAPDDRPLSRRSGSEHHPVASRGSKAQSEKTPELSVLREAEAGQAAPGPG